MNPFSSKMAYLERNSFLHFFKSLFGYFLEWRIESSRSLSHQPMGTIWCILIGRIRLTSTLSDIWPGNLWFYNIERNTFLFHSENRETVFDGIWTRTIFSTEPRNIIIINRIFFRFLGSVNIYSVSERFQTSGTVYQWRKFWFWDIKITKTDDSGHF